MKNSHKIALIGVLVVGSLLGWSAFATTVTFDISQAGLNPPSPTSSQSVTFNTKISDTGDADTNDSVVDFELFKLASSSTSVFQDFFTGQPFIHGAASSSYDTTNTPWVATPGNYKLSIGVFSSASWNSNGSATSWLDNAASFNIAGPTPTPTPTPVPASSSFTLTGSATASTVGQPVTLNANVTNNVASASDLVVDLEVSTTASPSSRVFQQFFTGQSIGSGVSVPFTDSTWVPDTAGDYKLAIGVFSSASWNSNGGALSFADNATTFTVAPAATPTPTPAPAGAVPVNFLQAISLGLNIPISPTPTPNPSSSEVRDQSSVSVNLTPKNTEFYKVGTKVYTSGGTMVSLSEFEALGLNFALIPAKFTGTVKKIRLLAVKTNPLQVPVSTPVSYPAVTENPGTNPLFSETPLPLQAQASDATQGGFWFNFLHFLHLR